MELRSELEKVLKEMKGIDGVRGAIIASKEGLLVASHFPAELDARLLAALAATLVKVSVMTTEKLGIGSFTHAVVKASNGYYVCFPVDTELVLACLLEKDVNLGLVLVRMERSIKEIIKILRSI
ncbi:MAG: roadblock/LC7 domain-containing protein [Candidatus Aenigmarchaeota archaeon]|nr:roadblock/LC7 domain-containing protein [Candidatus Aenigmarchaeota archaeon]